MKKSTLVVLLLSILLVSCVSAGAETLIIIPTETPQPTPTWTPEPTNTPRPTVTPQPTPTWTPVPTATSTPQPTVTPQPRPTEVPSTPTPVPMNTPVPTSTPTPTPVPSLRSLAQIHGMRIGTAVTARPLRDDPLYAETLAREFNILTLENAVKFGPVHPDKDRYDFRRADAIIDFAEAHEMQVRGHTLVWDAQLPTWLIEGSWTREELIEILWEHIMTVVGRYRGRIVAWDVVNEAIADDGSLRDTFWLRRIGPEYIEMAFRWAHEADPNALLFYNDYGAEGLSPKSDAVYALVRGLLQRGVPIHGVGFQMHTAPGHHPRVQNIAANMKRLAALGLEVHITEMEVKLKEPVTDEKLVKQARVYRKMLEVCLSTENCKAFVMWGFTDRHSYIPHVLPEWGAAHIFDESYNPKPAYQALMEALKAQQP